MENKYVKTGIEVTLREKENINSLLRRFNLRVRSSGILLVSRKKQYRKPIPNKIARRKSALVRAADRKKYKKLSKLGKI